jgi:hypothetical protein
MSSYFSLQRVDRTRVRKGPSPRTRGKQRESTTPQKFATTGQWVKVERVRMDAEAAG